MLTFRAEMSKSRPTSPFACSEISPPSPLVLLFSFALLLDFSSKCPSSPAAMLPSPTATASILRSAATRRTLTSTAAVRTTHPAHSSSGEQSVGQDMGEVKAKNSMVPVFMAIGAASVG